VVRAEMLPVYAELEQVKAALDEDTPMQALAVDGSEEEEEEEEFEEEETPQLGAAPTPAAVAAAGRSSELIGEPSGRRGGANSRSPRR